MRLSDKKVEGYPMKNANRLFLVIAVCALAACGSTGRPGDLGSLPPEHTGEAREPVIQLWSSFCSVGQCLTAVPGRSGGLQAGQPVLTMDPTSSNFSGSMSITSTDMIPTGQHQQLAASGDTTLCVGVGDLGGADTVELVACSPGVGQETAGTDLALQWGLIYNWTIGRCLQTNGVGAQPVWATCSPSNPSSQGWIGFGYQTWGEFIAETDSTFCGFPTNYWLDTASFCCQAGKVETAAAIGQCPSANFGQQPTTAEGGWMFFYDAKTPGYLEISQTNYGGYAGVSALLTDNGSGLPTFASPTGDDTQRWAISRGLLPIGEDTFVFSKHNFSDHWTWEQFSSGAQHEVALAGGATNAMAIEFRYK